jgi:hypothetical protein
MNSIPYRSNCEECGKKLTKMTEMVLFVYDPRPFHENNPEEHSHMKLCRTCYFAKKKQMEKKLMEVRTFEAEEVEAFNEQDDLP